MKNAIFGKTMENMGKHLNIKLVTIERRINYLVSEPNYHTTKFFTKKIISNRNEKNPSPCEITCLFRFINI